MSKERRPVQLTLWEEPAGPCMARAELAQGASVQPETF